MKFSYRNCERSPEPSFCRGRAGSFWTMRNYRSCGWRKSRSKVQDLENYILELIPTLPQLGGLEKSFYSFYVCTAVRKFFFFLDPLRTGQYLNLDKDHDGMLSKEELSRYGTGTLTSVFLDSVYQECLTYDGEIDY
ncbi:hypothetical protein J4Q44_G00225700 [Coregonus suidteri]|uniref:Uncharacterized protein n=1 Tax=Coregonus suidteri TaxID=861788 RepID=A0AAN8LFB5_9TELE